MQSNPFKEKQFDTALWAGFGESYKCLLILAERNLMFDSDQKPEAEKHQSCGTILCPDSLSGQ